MAGASNPFATRAFTFPEPGDTWSSLAARVHAGGDAAELLGWNPHLALRASTFERPGGLLPTDLIYTEAP